jgi:hypothetical protein
MGCRGDGCSTAAEPEQSEEDERLDEPPVASAG